LIAWRNIPVLLNGNVIRIPGHDLFVAEACSGLRSLTALVNLGVLLGAMLLVKPWSRVTLLILAVPMAILINGFRIFLTAFLVFFVSPEAGSGFMHTTEGWLMFVIAFASLGAVAALLLFIEGKLARRTPAPEPAHG
jgi:exosortase